MKTTHIGKATRERKLRKNKDKAAKLSIRYPNASH